MLSFPGSLRVFVALESCDMRKGYNGLVALVSERLEEDVRGGAVFVFSNRRHDRLKMLYWDGSGLWVMSNTHAPHCTHSIPNAAPLSISSAVWTGCRSIRCCRRTSRYNVCPSSQQHFARHSRVDV